MKFKNALRASFVLYVSLLSCKKDMVKEEVAELQTFENTVALAGTKPNVILIVGDDIGYEIPTCNGGQSYITPNIDKLAKQGMRFTQCHGSPLCSPSRFMLQTGKYNFRNYTVWGLLDTTEKTLGNLMKKGGYKTCFVGKWQLGGTDATIKHFGYDLYSLTDTRNAVNEDEDGYSRYKDPTIYQDGKYLPDRVINNKYSEDFFSKYLFSFIEKNKQVPFFAVYSLALAHRPFCPTPLDPQFASWDAHSGISDTSFFPSMIRYMDIKIGKLVEKLKSLNLENNTIIIFTGDNGTPGNPDGIYSLLNGKLIPGGKGKSIEYGTHVPLIVKWPGHILPNTVNKDLVNFIDFLPTLANAASISVPLNYGTIDGRSFFPQLTGSAGKPRDWIFNHYNPHPDNPTRKTQRWVQNTNYKLYDDGRFFNIIKDINEKNPIANSRRTATEKGIRDKFQRILHKMPN